MYIRKFAKNYETLEPFFALQNDFGNLLNTLVRNKKEDFTNINPSTDLYEDKNNFYITMELAGIEQSDIQISLEKNMLSISGEKKNINQNENHKFYHQEIVNGKFNRTFEFQGSINDENIEASFKNGVLTVKVEKETEKKDEVKKIEIKS
ncbi:Hsp20/alpha crystallin family protein [Fluviispira multicolorata]|uniref:Hsp20 family protein n=1 Tax=Fluviispira multicolorata TaxID=2654512 RepID=A0A833N7X1_9BACT|nr:Hsp20/alpha crystallin family protein [Fluviispira multicolorata]KAB8033416.1 Hsp20 family protein [Fluviispira multicolorata]